MPRGELNYSQRNFNGYPEPLPHSDMPILEMRAFRLDRANRNEFWEQGGIIGKASTTREVLESLIHGPIELAKLQAVLMECYERQRNEEDRQSAGQPFSTTDYCPECYYSVIHPYSCQTGQRKSAEEAAAREPR